MKNKAFTLAETLITLSILGLVAAVTIPSLVHKFQDRIAITQLKRAYAMIENALELAIVENGTLNNWNWPNPNGTARDNNVYFAQQMFKYFNVKDFCGENNACIYGKNIYDNGLKTINGQNGSSNAAYITNQFNMREGALLKNGMVVIFNIGDGNINNYVNGQVRVDINGKKGPNRWGYDVFLLPLPRYSQSKGGKGNLYIDCKGGHSSFIDASYCKVSDNKGSSCFCWIQKHNNMDYKYRDVSAEW